MSDAAVKTYWMSLVERDSPGQVNGDPDFVYFDHRAHVTAAVRCQQCHGPVESMERVRQVETLAMGWCVNCHRDVNQAGVAGKPVHASIDCVTCHY